jgi:hypothetical protein
MASALRRKCIISLRLAILCAMIVLENKERMCSAMRLLMAFLLPDAHHQVSCGVAEGYY